MLRKTGLQPSRVGSLLHGASCCTQPSALPISSRDNQKPATSQVDGVAHGKAAPLPETAGAVEGPAKPVALSELGAWGADLSLVLKMTGNGRVAHHTCRPRTLHAASDDAWSVLESHILG
ncbi:hypothetical protein ACKKBG_A18125 [Auxenochlorella protothecoides x Auxenochlorella symbiontica]